MTITSKILRKIRKHLENILKCDVQFEENNIKKNGSYIDIVYKGAGNLSRSNKFYAICDLIIVIQAPAGNFDSVTAKIMTAESNLLTIAFTEQESQNIERYQKVENQLRYGILLTDTEAQREIENGTINYRKTYEMKIYIGE